MTDDGLPTVACVLKRGGVYDFNYVKILSLALRRRLRRDYRFVCLTDVPPPHRKWLRAHRINLRPLRHGWPGAWSKIELFRPDLFAGRVLYLDLDTLVTGRLTRLIDYEGAFATSSDVLRPLHFDCSVMAWQAGMLDFLYADFVPDAAILMHEFHRPVDWIAFACRRKGIIAERLESLMPGLITNAVPIAGGAPIRIKPPGTKLICFHGPEKPHRLLDTHELVRDHWH
jgi:hypothetical protein